MAIIENYSKPESEIVGETRRLQDIYGVTALFNHTLTSGEWLKAAKMVSTDTAAYGCTVKTTTGYAKILNYDGTYEAVDGAGVPANNITVLSKAPASPFDTKIPKFYAVLPCDVAGTVGGEITYISSNATKITSLDVSGLASITYLSVVDNNLTSLNVAGLTSLTQLFCYANNLTSLSISGLTSLNSIYCQNNNLTSLDTSGLTSLNELSCSSNNLTSLDVSSSPALLQLYCDGNAQLTDLTVGASDFTGQITAHSCPLLSSIRGVGAYASSGYGFDFSNNTAITDAVAEQFFTDLAAGSVAIDLSGTSVTGSLNVSIATGKGYTVITP